VLTKDKVTHCISTITHIEIYCLFWILHSIPFIDTPLEPQLKRKLLFHRL